MLIFKKIFFGVFMIAVSFGFFCPDFVFGTVPSSTIQLENPLKTESIFDLMASVVNTALGLMGSAALVVFVYGGAMWLVAAGNQERVKKGTQAMVWAVIGIFIILGSYVILSLVFEGFGVKEDVPQTFSWCLTPENQCVQGAGGACPSGTAHASEHDCLQNIKQCYCHPAFETMGIDPENWKWVSKMELQTERACLDYSQQTRPIEYAPGGTPGEREIEGAMDCKWLTKSSIEQNP